MKFPAGWNIPIRNAAVSWMVFLQDWKPWNANPGAKLEENACAVNVRRQRVDFPLGMSWADRCRRSVSGIQRRWWSRSRLWPSQFTVCRSGIDEYVGSNHRSSCNSQTRKSEDSSQKCPCLDFGHLEIRMPSESLAGSFRANFRLVRREQKQVPGCSGA